MIFRHAPAPRYGDRRALRLFAWWPTRIDAERTVWLGRYEEEQSWYQLGRNGAWREVARRLPGEEWPVYDATPKHPPRRGGRRAGAREVERVSKREPFTGIVYHWSPSARRRAILRDGLVPGKSRVTHSRAMPYLCFAPTSGGAWSLSAGTGWTKAKQFDLWVARLIPGDRANQEPGPPDEVRTRKRIPPSRLILACTDVR